MNIRKSFNLAKRHKKFNPKILKSLKTQSESLISTISTPEARQLYNWNRQVAGCYQLSRGFARLKINSHGIVYGSINPEHYVEDLVARWFLSRFPLFTIIIESQRGTFVISKEKGLSIYKKKISEILPDLESSLPKNTLLEDLEDFNDDEYWNSYYSSQLIESRKNKRYFQKNLPKKYLDWGSLNVEKDNLQKNHNLTSYFN